MAADSSRCAQPVSHSEESLPKEFPYLDGIQSTQHELLQIQLILIVLICLGRSLLSLGIAGGAVDPVMTIHLDILILFIFESFLQINCGLLLLHFQRLGWITGSCLALFVRLIIVVVRQVPCDELPQLLLIFRIHL